jgi:hypothetical protein
VPKLVKVAVPVDVPEPVDVATDDTDSVAVDVVDRAADDDTGK